MAAVVYRGRSLRSRRLGGSKDNGDEIITLDFTKAPGDNLKEILMNIVNYHAISKARRLGYFNAFVRLCYRFGTSFQSDFSKEEILAILRLGLFHEGKEMRSGCLRALRYFCEEKSAVQSLLRLRIDFLIARSLDFCQDNELERIHAFRIIRKLMHLAPEIFPVSLLNVMVSIAKDGTKERDRMIRTCLATLCELAFLNPEYVSRHGVVTAILHNVLDCHQLPRINESLLAAILYLLNHPRTRHLIKPEVDMEQLFAPFTDCHYRLRGESGTDLSPSEERENQFVACKMALGTIFKSWPGIIRMCRPDSSALQSLLGVLYLPDMKTRREIMDIVFDVLRLPLPEWTEDFSQALLSVDPSELHDDWKLTEGFVAEEGKTLVPNLAKTRPNLVDNHVAIILSAFISAGLLEALIEVIISSDEHICVRASILLGEILHLASTILPHESSHHSHCLPSLMAIASSFESSSKEQNCAYQAINRLNRLHSMKKRGAVPCSLFLDRIVQSGQQTQKEAIQPVLINRLKLIQAFEQTNQIQPASSFRRSTGSFRTRSRRSIRLKYSPVQCSASRPFQCLPLRLVIHDSDHNAVHQAIKNSNVLQTKENFTWDWDLISAVLMWPDEALKKLDDQSNQRFIRRLIYFFKPTNRLFSVTDFNHVDVKKIFLTAKYFIAFLLSYSDQSDEASKMIEELLGDINRYLSECGQPSPPHDSLFSPANLAKSCSQYYFLLIGSFSSSSKGESYLESSGIYQSLLNAATTKGTHDSYIKLMISSLDYSNSQLARELLSKVLTSACESAKLYTVKFLRVLLRSQVAFVSNWGLEMLVMQLYDQSRVIAMEALSVISEACESEANLYSLVKMRPSVLHLGHKGSMLLARFLSIPKGFKFLQDANFIKPELEKWHKSFCVKYVQIVEERLNEALTTYEKTYDGTYMRRSSRRISRNDVYVPVHIYGQLTQHKYGFQLLEEQEYVEDYFQCIRSSRLFTDDEILQVKAALWAVGHIGTSVWGMKLLHEQNIIPEIIKLAEQSGVFSMRGTAYNVLGLIACTRSGADALNDYGWETVRHSRGDTWPVLEEGELQSGYVDAANLSLSTSPSSVSLSSNSKMDLSTPISSSVIYPQMSTLTAADQAEEEEIMMGRSSPLSSGSSPKVSFVIGSFDSRSRSNTGASMGQVGLSFEEVEYLQNGNESHPITIEVSEHKEVVNEAQTNGDTLDGGTYPEDSDNKRRSKSMVDSTDLKVDLLERTSPDPSEGRKVTSEKKSDGVSVHFDVQDIIEEAEAVVSDSNRTIISKATSNGPISNKVSEQLSVRDWRSNSDESTRSRTTSNKSRSDSMFTDTSSGFCSLESTHYHGANSEPAQLSPIASASSLVMDQSLSPTVAGSFHPSDILRNQANLKRIPSLRKRHSNPVLGHISPSNTIERKRAQTVNYTSSKDLHGYAALRELKRNRTISHELEAQATAQGVIDQGAMSSPYPSKSSTLDFRLGNFSGSSYRNPSSNSLEEMDSPVPHSSSTGDLLSRTPATSNPKKLQNRVGRAEYVGISLPADVTMIFEVVENGDPRSRPHYNKSSPKFDSLRRRKPPPSPTPSQPLRSGSRTEDDLDDCFQFHSTDQCFACMTIRPGQKETADVIISGDSDGEDAFFPARDDFDGDFASGLASPVAASFQKSTGMKSRNNSVSDAILTGSVTSTTSLESSAQKALLDEDTPMGKALLRKEVLRFITNLGSSIGVKSAEQGLLSVKQKFPKVFSDLCLYYEISCMLAHYGYRLAARRFIQELFQDVEFEKLYDEPRRIVGLGEDNTELSPTYTEADIKLERVLESIA